MSQSLAEKLAALTNPTPDIIDHVDGDDEDNVTGARVEEVEHLEDDSVPGERSYLRTVNASTLDEDSRYKGKKIKRKDFQKDRDLDFEEHSTAELGHLFDHGEDEEDGGTEDEDSDDDKESEGEDNEHEEGDDSWKEELDNDSEEGKEENEGEESEDEEDEDAADDEFGVDISSFAKEQSHSQSGENDQNMFKVAESDSLFAKSQAVVAQLKSWDKLLEQRIMLQKMLTKVNTFPTNPDSFLDSDDTDHTKLHNKANKALGSLLLKTVQLKNSLERRGVEDSKAMKRKLEDMSEWLEEDFSSGDQRRRERISLWSDRTQRLGNMSSMNTPTLEQIDQITSNMPRLVKRTKVARVECNILGEDNITNEDGQTENDNIFDDSDFYHHLLRELIEKKTSASTESGEVGKHWLQIQKLRSKLKKKVDTRASKGRKVRYDIHTKLVNFMAPVRLPNQMADNARQELFASLFGARKF